MEVVFELEESISQMEVADRVALLKASPIQNHLKFGEAFFSKQTNKMHL